jgi:hypothetical protein
MKGEDDFDITDLHNKIDFFCNNKLLDASEEKDIWFSSGVNTRNVSSGQ